MSILDLFGCSAPSMTSDLRGKLLSKVTIARVLMWVCLSAAAIPALVTIFRFVTLPDTPESGFEGMAIVFAVFTWGPALLFPLLGFVFALSWKRKLERELHERDDGIKSQKFEPCAAPNGGPAAPVGNSGVTGGPPSVS